MEYLFVLIVGLLGVGVYLTMMFSAIPGAVDERLGPLDALPKHLGKWREDQDSPEGADAQQRGLLREVRILHSPPKGLFGRETLTTQVRYRELETRKIVQVDPEQVKHRTRRRPE